MLHDKLLALIFKSKKPILTNIFGKIQLNKAFTV